ncbi:glycosyltransferase [bacterium]|nr:glycosyltransferase [bacterium]
MVVLVTGMHRSGTSAVAEFLIEGGFHGGEPDAMMPASAENERGFFERVDVADLNDRLLRAVHAHWLAPPLDTSELVELAGGPLGDEARQVLASIGASSEEILLKDPRFCLTLPFWRAVLGGELRAIVLVFRKPQDVVASLLKRDGLAEPIGVHLWTAYYQEALAATKGLPVFPVAYDDLLSDPKRALEALNDAFEGFSVTRAIESNTLDQRLRHHNENSEEQLTGQAAEVLNYLVGLQAGIGQDAPALAVDGSVATALGVAWIVDRHFGHELVEVIHERDEARSRVERQRLVLERERDDAREAHRLTGQQLAETRRRLSDYEGSHAAGFARRLWATKRRIREAKKRLPSRSRLVEQPKPEVVDAGVLPPVSLPTFDEPLVSIVIPIFGQLAMTAGCLRSIERATEHVPYEVIIVDDSSPDESLIWLDRCANVRVIANSTNQGFLRSTNIGAAAARGSYVCLLNNDTEVHPGWLTALLRPFNDADDVGAVGAKLVYPDGKLQEGGGIVFSDASGWNFGRTGDPDAPEVNFLREVDYCSAACLLVSKEVWDALGGFDERFVPAYYEDTDLAFALRDKGKRVLYQPAAVVTHFEGVSHGTDETQGMKAYQVQNQATFQNKWSKVLPNQQAPGSSPRRASWRGAGPRVLVIDHEVPAPDQDSGSVRMAAILELLSDSGFKVSFLASNRFRREPYCSQLQSKGIEVLYGQSDVEPHLIDIRSELAFVSVSRPNVAQKLMPLLRRLAPDVPVVYDMVDFHGLRLKRRSEMRREPSDLDESARVADMEKGFARDADHVLAITADEAALMRELEPAAKVSVLPNIHRSPQSLAGFDERNGVLFIGSYRHVPNQDAIDWLLSEIMPRIWEQDDSITFHLVGSDLPDELLRIDDPRIVVHGWLPHLNDVFERVRLTIAPLRFGAGLKGKVGDSLARGVPCVSTDIGAEGFGPVADVLLVANTADELADLVVQTHNDAASWTERAAEGALLLDQHFGYAAARNALASLLVELDVVVPADGR